MITFTICSNNYLQKAKVLVDSIKKNEDVKVYLFLADSLSPQIDYKALGFDAVVLPEELGIPNLQWQLENYNIIEFNTALKGEAFKYLFKNTEAETLYYFDPDIKVYESVSKFAPQWENGKILLTPHVLTPIPFDDKFPGENLFLNHGIYNLGFLGLKRSKEADAVLDWWCERLSEKCIIDLSKGYFTDQIWFTLVPLLFNKVTVLKHQGFNASYWNLHERKITKLDNKFKVNENDALYFFHFSSFDKSIDKLMPSDNPRYTFKTRPELISLFEDYGNDLEGVKQFHFQDITYFEGRFPLPKPQRSLINRIGSRIKREIKS